MPLLLHFQRSIVPWYMLPFNVIYGRHHDVVERIWALQSNLNLNLSSSYLPALHRWESYPIAMNLFPHL